MKPKYYKVSYYTSDWAHLTVIVDAENPYDAEMVARERYNNIAQVTEVREVLYKW